MPKRKQNEPPAEQGKRFVAEAQRMVDAGELSPTDAEGVLEKLVRNARQRSDSR